MATYTDSFSSGGATLKLVITREDYSITKNTSYLKCVLKITKDKDYSSFNNGGASISMTINGTKLYSSDTFDIRSLSIGGTKTLATKYITVSHNSDGTKSVSCKASFVSGVALGSASISATYTCETIPRASTITSAGNRTLGNACSIKWTPKSKDFKYKLKFSIGVWSYTTDQFITPNTTSAFTYTGYKIPSDSTILKQIPNSETGTMNVTLYSYNSGGTSIGSDDASFTVTVPSSVVPSVGTVTVTTNPISDTSILLQNKNTITVSVSNSKAGTGSSIKSYRYYCLIGDKVIADSKETTKTSVTLGPFSSFGTIKIKVVVTDKRTRSAINTSNTVECYEYTPPAFDSFDPVRIEKPIKTTEELEDGSTIEKIVSYTYDINYNGSIKNFTKNSNINNKLTVNLYYKEVGGAEESVTPVTLNMTENGGKFTAVKKDIEEDKTYIVWAEMFDEYTNTSTPIVSESKTIYASLRIMNVQSDGTFSGTGIGIGQKSKNIGFVESAYNIATTELVNNIEVFDGNGYFMTSAWGDLEPAIYRNKNASGTKSNLWIGATAQGGKHFTNGSTYISTGSDTNIYVSKDTDGNGERTNYTILDAENCYDYSDKIRVKMYSNLSGSASNITFINGVKASDFNFIEIYYKTNNDVGRKSTKAFLNKQTGLSVEISHCEPISTENSIYIKTSLFVINDTTLTWKRGKYTKLSGTSAETIEYTENKILITGVYGYK